MPPKPRAKWSTMPREVVMRTDADGGFFASVPLLDGGVRQMTVVFEVTADREVRVLVKGEPGATLTGFTAWSDL